MDSKTEVRIVAAGSGWMVAGASSLALYAYRLHLLTFLAIGILALVSGLWIIMARKGILRFRERIIAAERGHGSK